MAKSREIEIVIAPEGGVTVEGYGYKGKGCSKDLDEVTNMLGRATKVKKKKGSFDKQEVRTRLHEN